MNRIRLVRSAQSSRRVGGQCQLTIIRQLQRPHSGRHTRQWRSHHRRHFQTLLQCPECTPGAPAAGGVDLRRVAGRTEQIDDLGIGDGVERSERVNKQEVLQGSWREEGVREGCSGLGIAVLGIVGRQKLLLVVVVAEILELVEVSAWSAAKDGKKTRARRTGHQTRSPQTGIPT